MMLKDSKKNTESIEHGTDRYGSAWLTLNGWRILTKFDSHLVCLKHLSAMMNEPILFAKTTMV